MGMELAALEFARNVAGLEHLCHAGMHDGTGDSARLELSQALMVRVDAEGHPTRERTAFRKGLYAAALERGSTLRRAYGDAEFVRERHRNEFELNPLLVPALTAAGLRASGFNPDSQLVEAFELKNHPWFIGVIFHPEFKSRPVDPHPLFRSFVGAAAAQE
jgi:CTP synthase